MIPKSAREWLAQIGSKGGKNAAKAMTKAQRRARAIKARAARTAKHRTPTK